MATLTPQPSVRAGVALTFVAASGGGDQYPATGNEEVVVRNTSGAPQTVTAVAQKACDYGVSHAAHDLAMVVAAGTIGRMRPSPIDKFKDVNGRVQLTYTGVSGIEVAIVAD